MWELRGATIQGRAPKVISTALFEDVFPDYISPALVSLIAKHAPQELDLFEHVLRSLKNSAHVSRPEVGHQKKYSKARSQRQCRNEATNNPTASKLLSSPAKNCKSQNISKRLLIFSPETPRRTDKGTCLLLESETVPLENGIEKFEAPCSRTSAVASSSTTMISTAISKEENTDACHIRPEQLAKEVTIQYECMPDEIASGSRNPCQVSQLDFKDSAACMEATSNYSEQTGRSMKASMLDKPTKPAQASRNYVPTSKRVRGETCGQNHKLVELKKIQNQKPDNVVSSTERRSPGSGTSNEKPWRHGMKLVKRLEDIGAMPTSSATWKDQKAPVPQDERASITRNKQRMKEFDLKRRLELHKEDSHFKTKRPNYQRPPWDPDCSLPCCDDNGPWQWSPQMEDFEIDLPFPQHTYVGPGSVHIQPESVEKTYWQCDDDGVLQIFHYKNRNFFSQEISIKQLESFHNDHFMEGHLKHQYPESKRADGYMRHRNGAHHAEFRREKGKAARKDNKSGSNMPPSVSTRLPSDKRIKQIQVDECRKQHKKNLESAENVPKRKVNSRQSPEVLQNGISMSSKQLGKRLKKTQSMPSNSLHIIPPHCGTESTIEDEVAISNHDHNVDLQEVNDATTSTIKNKSTTDRNFSLSIKKPTKELARVSASTNSKSTIFARRKLCHQEKQEKRTTNSACSKRIKLKHSSVNVIPTSKEDQSAESPSDVSQAATCWLQCMPLLKIIIRQWLKCVDAAYSCLNSKNSTQLDLMHSKVRNQVTIDSNCVKDTIFDWHAKKCPQILTEINNDSGVIEFLSLQKLSKHPEDITLNSSSLSDSLSRSFHIWREKLDLSDYEQDRIVPDSMKLSQYDEKGNRDIGFSIQLGLNDSQKFSIAWKRSIEPVLVNNKKSTSECCFTLSPNPGDVLLIASEDELKAVLSNACACKILNFSPNAKDTDIPTSLKKFQNDTEVLDKEDVLGIAKHKNTQKKKWCLPEERDPLSVINIYRRHWVCKEDEQKVDVKNSKLNEVVESQDGSQALEGRIAQKAHKNQDEAFLASVTNESSKLFIPVSNGTRSLSSGVSEKLHNMMEFEKRGHLVSTTELNSSLSNFDASQENLFHREGSISNTGNKEPLEIPNGSPASPASSPRRCNSSRKYKAASLDKKRVITPAEYDMFWCETPETSLSERLQSCKRRNKNLKRRKRRQKAKCSVLPSGCYAHSTSPLDSSKRCVTIPTSVVSSTIATDYGTGIGLKENVARIEDDLQSVRSSTNCKDHFDQQECQKGDQKQCQAAKKDDHFQEVRILFEEERKCLSVCSHSSSEKAIMENLKCSSVQETRAVELLQRDVLQKRREAQQLRLKWKRQLLEDELQQLELEINETKGRMQFKPYLGQTHKDSDIHRSSYINISPADQPHPPDPLLICPQNTGPEIVKSSTSIIKRVELDLVNSCPSEEMLESIASTTNYSDTFVNEQEGATSFHKISMPKKIEDFDHVEEVDTGDENVEAGLSRSSTEVVSTENSQDREEHAHPIICNKLEVHLTSVFKSEVETFLYKPPFSPSPQRETAVDEIDEDFEFSPRTELGERHLKDLATVTLQLNQAEKKPPCISQYSSLLDFTQELVSQAMPPRIPDSVLKEMVEPLEDDCLTSSRNYPLLMNSAFNNRNEILDRRCSDLKPEKNEQSNDLKFSSSDTCRVIEKEETEPSKEEDWNSVEATAPLSGRFEVHIGNLKNPKSLEVSRNKGIDEVLEEKIIEVLEDEISEVSEEECLQTVLSTGESGSELEVGGTKLAEKTNLSSKLSGSTSALVPGSLIGNKLFEISIEDEIGEVSDDVSLKTDVYSSDNSDFCQ